MIGLALAGARVGVPAARASATPDQGSTVPPRTSTPSPSPSPDATPTATLTTAPPPPTATPAGPGPLPRALAGQWIPDGTTIVVERAEPSGAATLVAVGLGDGRATPIAELGPHLGWDLRITGTSLAVAVPTADRRGARIATLDLRTGAAAWLTSIDHFTDRAPVWSPDGAFVFFGRSDANNDLGLHRVRTDGAATSLVRSGLGGVGFSVPLRMTPDGGGLVWSRRVGTDSVEVFDIATGADRSFGRVAARPAAWRTTTPRALVELATSFGTGGALVLWDDITPTAPRRELVAPGAVVRGADWDPAGTRVVAATRASQLGAEPVRLVTMDASGGARATVAGSEDATSPLWLRAGIAYLHGADAGAVREVRLIAPAGGTARTLYRADAELVRLVFVSP